MEKIGFSYNWNGKLHTDNFTTFRLHNPKKYVIGRDYEIDLKGVSMGNRRCLDIRVLTLDQVNEWIARLDTGYGLEEFKKLVCTMYKKVPNIENQKFDLLLLSRVGTKGQQT